MKNKTKLFTESIALGGWTLSVRNDWNYKIKKVNISNAEKIEYEKYFGNEIVTFDVFFNWWKKIHEQLQQEFNTKIENDTEFSVM